MNFALLALAGFISGSVPFSLLVGKLAGRRDIRFVGDGNPGATNVGRMLGWRWFAVALLLDALKGAIPVAFAFWGAKLQAWELALAALSPILGHAFSPWLKFRGGKAVAVTFGVWAGLTLWAVPIMLGFFLTIASAVVQVSGWALILAFAALGAFIEINYASQYPEFRIIWVLNAAILVVKHLADLRQPPGLRSWVTHLAKRL